MKIGRIRIVDLDSFLNIPPCAGVYRYEIDRPRESGSYKEVNPAGRLKGDSTVSQDVLKKKWVAKTTIVYIGQTKNLRERIILRARFADGERVRAWGGRYLWQLDDSIQRKMSVCWETCDNPKDMEKKAIDNFKKNYGNRLPFANLRT